MGLHLLVHDHWLSLLALYTPGTSLNASAVGNVVGFQFVSRSFWEVAYGTVAIGWSVLSEVDQASLE